MAGKAAIQVVLFDLGNVFVDFDHTIAAKRILHFCDKTPQEIFELFFASRITSLFEEGKIAPYDFFLEVKEMLGLRLSYESFVPIWNEIFSLSGKNREVYSLANNLRAGYTVALISNINMLHYEYLQKKFPVFNVFDRVFTSFELGAVKPDHAIYRKALSALGVLPGQVFYTDDRPELVESANLLGMRGYVFQGVGKLKKDFLTAGVSIS